MVYNGVYWPPGVIPPLLPLRGCVSCGTGVAGACAIAVPVYRVWCYAFPLPAFTVVCVYIAACVVFASSLLVRCAL